jgi:hypothetical protein
MVIKPRGGSSLKRLLPAPHTHAKSSAIDPIADRWGNDVSARRSSRHGTAHFRVPIRAPSEIGGGPDEQNFPRSLFERRANFGRAMHIIFVWNAVHLEFYAPALLVAIILRHLLKRR